MYPCLISRCPVVTDSCWAFHRLQRSKTEPAIPGYQDAQRSRASKALTKTTSDAGPSNTLPVYSYKDHEDPAIVVYTKNEEEANDLIGCLHG
jgi:hypothetical protein